MRFIQLAADAAHIDSSRLEACSCATRMAATKRPRFTVLGSERGVLLPTLEDALRRYASSLREQGLTELPREMRSRARV
jgi:dTDP-4-dehydrorhamnose reductase